LGAGRVLYLLAAQLGPGLALVASERTFDAYQEEPSMKSPNFICLLVKGTTVARGGDCNESKSSGGNKSNFGEHF